MEIARLPFDGTTSVVRWLWRRVSRPKRRADEPKEQMSEALARLAETSPHLLRDIGLRLDSRSSSPTREVWTKGGLCIEVVRYHTGTDVQIGGLTARSDDAAAALEPVISL